MYLGTKKSLMVLQQNANHDWLSRYADVTAMARSGALRYLG